MRVRGMGEKAQKGRIRAVKDFAAVLGRAPDRATREDLRAYQLHMAEENVGIPTFNHRIVALRFFFSITCGRDDMKRHMQFRRAPRKLPLVLSPEEVSEILDAAPGAGLKYKAALSIGYGAGLRANEVVNLKIGDIDSDRMLIRVEQGKGNKDRHVMLSPSLLDLLRAYYRNPIALECPGGNRDAPARTPLAAANRIARVNWIGPDGSGRRAADKS